MREKDCKATAESLFVGGGEIGELLRSHDWSPTSLGSVETWSDDLKTAVQIVLTELDRAQPTKKTALNSDPPQNATEAALRQSEAKYRTLFEAIDQGFCVGELIWDETGNPQDHRVLEINSAFERLTGLKHVAGKVGSELIPTLEPFWLEAYARVVRTGESARFESHIQGLDGWFDVYVAAIDAPESDQFVVVFQNITERKRTEEILQGTASLNAFRAALADALRSLTDPIEIQAVASRVLGEYLGANRVAYFEVRGADYAVERDYVNGAEPIAGHYPIDSFDPRQLAAFRQGRTATSSDVPADAHLSPEQHSAFAAIGIGAYVGVPLIKQGEFVAGLAVHTIEPRNWTPDDIALTEEVAERTWAAVERARVEAALRQSETRFRRIFECNMVPIAVWTMTGGITQANDALLDMIGYTRSELEMGQINWQALTPAEYRSLDEIALNEIATQGVSVPYEKMYVCKDGKRIPILIGAASFVDDANSGIFFAIDLTDRKQAKAALRESEERYRTLFESINQGFCLLEVLFDANDKAYDYRYLEINEAFEQQSGLTNAIGKTIRELVPNLEPQWGECYEQVVKLRESVRFEADVPSMNRVFDIYAVPSGAPGQNLVSVLFTDITDRKRREANLAFLAEVQDDCARLTTAEELMQTIGAKIGAYLNLSICAFVDVDEAQDQAIVPYCWHRADVPNLVGTYRISEFVSQEFYIAARAGVAVVVNDTNTDARTDAANCAAIGIQSFIHVPLLHDGQWKFLFNVYDSRPRNWREDEIELFGELANRIFQSLERARAEVALRQSEERYRTLFESIDEGFCVIEVMVDRTNTPTDYRVLEVNPVFEQQTGIPQAVGRTARQLNLEDHWIEVYGRVALTGEPVRFESGSDVLGRWFDVYACRTGEPEARKVAIVFKDISDRKQSEAIIATDLVNTRLLRDLSARLTSEDNIQVLYDEIMATAIALTKADAGTVQILDSATQDLLLLATQGFDRAMTDHFYRVNASSNTPCGIALKNGIRSFIDFDVPECDDPDGSLRMHVNAGYLSAQSTPLISRSGRAIGMVSTHWGRQHRPSDRELRFLDLLARQAAALIEQRQTEAERQQSLQREQAAREEAERANRIKDEFLAVLSHELRSPLNPILGWTRLLQSGKLDAVRQAEALATIERNAKLQTQLIEDLLDISRIMQGKLSLTVAPVSLTFVIAAALETVRLAAEAKHIQITLDLDPAVSSISGDAARLQQVVWNLLTNAVKFTPNGGQVIVELRQIDQLAQIRVIDTGKGINPQFLPHVFEYFRQEDGSTTRKFGGLGLGLAIVRQIVEMHGGTVEAESQGEGLGATFVVELPLPQRTENRGLRTEDLALSTQSSALSTPLAGIQILLVDDETDTREFQAFLLEQNGATVTTVASGLEALQALEQLIPDLLVSDIGMAEMDGYMLLQQIQLRQPRQGGTIPAIALTAYAAEVDQQRALQVGFQRHLTKPVESEALVKAIVNLLRERSGQ